MLNTHPEVCILYEANLANRPLSPRGAQFMAAFPEFQPHLDANIDFPQVYHALAEFLAENGHPYHFVGDKILTSTLDHTSAEALADHRVIFTVRDLRTWLCKNVVISNFVKGRSIAETACTYLDQYLASFLLPHCLHITMEELVERNTEVITLLSGFLQLDFREHAQEWWKKVGQWPAGDPKAAVNWWQGHDSSQLAPRRLDTKAVLRAHPFWEEVLPIFDRYYHGRLTHFEPSQIAQDRAALAQIKQHEIDLKDLYKRSRSVSFGGGWFGSWGHRSKNPNVKPYET